MNRYEANFRIENTVRSEYIVGKNWNDVRKKLNVIYPEQKIEIMSISEIQTDIKTFIIKK